MSLTAGDIAVFRDALQTAIAAFKATLPKAVVVIPSDDTLGYDISCTDDLTELMLEVSELRALAEAAFRRITTPRGRVIDAPDYGRDIRSLLSKGMTPASRATSIALFVDEILKDERIERCDIETRELPDAGLALTISCVAALGPFRLTVHVSQAGVALTEVL